MTGDIRKPYEPPVIDTQRAFEVLAAGCGLHDPTMDMNCDPEYGGTLSSAWAGVRGSD